MSTSPPVETRSRWSWPIGRAGGVAIRAHASFVLLAALIVAATASQGARETALAVLWLLPLFACVLVHELAHTLMARRSGIEVTEIELLPIGGLSKLAENPDDPAVELRIAVAGPLASIGLAVLCALAAVASGAAVWPPTLYAGDLLVRLAWVNLVLGAFNLLPALPLDGGRVFRAALEERVGHRKAVATAGLVGRDLAVLLVVAGLVVNPLLIVLGALVFVASQAEAASAELHDKVKDLTVADVMRPPAVPLTVGDLTPGDAVLAPGDRLETSGLLDHEPDVAAVVEDGVVLGVATAADVDRLVRRLLSRPTRTKARTRVRPPPPPPPLPGPPAAPTGTFGPARVLRDGGRWVP